MSKERLFLIVTAVGLIPIALAYGVAPGITLPVLYGLEIDNVSALHILRAIMGLYLAMVTFWLLGAWRATLLTPALYSVAVFMLGLAAGRTLSLVMDGMPSPLLVVYLALEVALGAVALWLASQQDNAAQPS